MYSNTLGHTGRIHIKIIYDWLYWCPSPKYCFNVRIFINVSVPQYCKCCTCLVCTISFSCCLQILINLRLLNKLETCSEEDSIYSSTSTGSDVIMTSNCIYYIIVFSSSLLKSQMTLSEKIISFRAFSVLHFKETRL